MKAVAVILSLMLVSACTVGPDYARPEFHLPADYRGRHAGARLPKDAEEIRSELVAWWHNFDDHVLTELVEESVRTNLDLRQARSRVLQARASRRAATAELSPNLGFNAGYRRSGRDESGDALIVSDGEGDVSGRRFDGQNLFEVGLDASWELDFFGGARRGVEAADFRVRFAEEDTRDVLISVAAEVATEYFNLRAAQQQLDVAENNLRIQQQTVDLTERRRVGGFASAFDVSSASAQRSTTQAQLPLLRAAADRAQQNLAVLLGRAPGELPTEISARAPLPLLPMKLLLDLPSDLLRRRPDIRRAEASAQVAAAEVGIATAELYPKFTLSGSFGVEGDTFRSATDAATQFWSFGPSMSWPLFDAGRIRANIGVRNEVAEQALLTYRKAVLTGLKDVESALTGIAANSERRAALDDAARASVRAHELSREVYTGGFGDFLTVLSAERTLYSSQDALVQQHRALLADVLALYKALGGGFVVETEIP